MQNIFHKYENTGMQAYLLPNLVIFSNIFYYSALML